VRKWKKLHVKKCRNVKGSEGKRTTRADNRRRDLWELEAWAKDRTNHRRDRYWGFGVGVEYAEGVWLESVERKVRGWDMGLS